MKKLKTLMLVVLLLQLAIKITAQTPISPKKNVFFDFQPAVLDLCDGKSCIKL